MALSSTEVELDAIEVGSEITAVWQGKPVFVRHRTKEEIAAAEDVDITTLPDPQADADRVENPAWLIMVGVCTHLGCVPLKESGDYDGWFCPCHGSHYDTSGRIRKGPAPLNLLVPPYEFLSDTTVKNRLRGVEMSFEPKNPMVKWVEARLPITGMLHHALYEYPTPKNLSYWWTFGSLAGFMLVVQLITGIVLSMHYTAHVDLAFDSVEHIMRDVNYGWLLRYMHSNGASMFFIVVYLHIFRGLYYGSYKAPRELLWWLGLVIFLLMMATAFMGYVLPWGQMSFWGATVITNLFGAIPVVGDTIVTWLWGGFSVDNPTLNRFLQSPLPTAICYRWCCHPPRLGIAHNRIK